MHPCTQAPLLGALALALSLLGVHALDSTKGALQHARPLRTFIPHWMAKGKLGSGMLYWKSDSPLPQGLSYSQDHEDTTAEAQYFHNLHNGTFLELGALDGTKFSNTRLYEEQRGWRGLLVEPNREEYEKIPSTRPEAIAVHAAICDQARDVHFISRRSHQQAPGSAGALSTSCPSIRKGYSAMLYEATTSPLTTSLHLTGLVGGIWEFMAESFRMTWYGTTDIMPEGAEVVPCVALGSILQTFGISHIDFLSLDVEGAELEVLQTLDLSAVHINVMVIEQDGRSPAKDEAVRQKLLAHNFQVDESMKDTEAGSRNDWFVHKHFRRSAAPA